MQFQVPQFIEVEDRVFGPFTIKQFIYIAGGGGLMFILYRFLGFFFGIIPILVVAALTFALAFYKHNNRPFIDLIESSVTFYTKNRLYIWKKDTSIKQYTQKQEQKQAQEKNAASPKMFVPTLSESKLKELAWSLDIKESVNPLTGKDGSTNTR